MLKIKEAIIVEGRYDKIKLKNLVDTTIIETNGFRVFSDKEKQTLIRKIAQTRGILVFTDSDSAGFVIRNFLRGTVDKSKIKHCYIPQINGKEKRKAHGSKEGFLGVEGVSDDVIIKAIRKSGATIIGEDEQADREEVTKADLYRLGLTGRENSEKLRKALLKHLDMPSYLTANAMLSAINCLYSLDTDTVVGTATIYYQDDKMTEKQELATVNLVPSEKVELSGFLYVMNVIGTIMKSYWFLVAVGVIVIILVIYYITSKINRKKAKAAKKVKHYRNL